MFYMPLDQIEKTTIESLIEGQAREDLTLEYKEKLPGGDQKDKFELWADVSAMANAAGGDIVFGIAEKREDNQPTGLPDRVSGLSEFNFDAETRRLGQSLEAGVEPRIAGLQWKVVQGFESGPVLVLRVPKSYSSPHMVKNADSRFYTRVGARRSPMDVRQIRSAFSISESLPERIRHFRDDRNAQITSGPSPARGMPNPKSVLHVLPLSSLESMQSVDVKYLYDKFRDYPPLEFSLCGGLSRRYNLEGVLVTATQGNGTSPIGYVQLFRSGAIEAVEGATFGEQTGSGYFEAQEFERTAIRSLHRLLGLLNTIRVEPPIFVMLSLIKANGSGLLISRGLPITAPVSPASSRESEYTIDRSPLLLPELLLQSYDELPTDKLLQPAFDAVWQCVGFERDYHYREDGAGRWLDSKGGSPLAD